MVAIPGGGSVCSGKGSRAQLDARFDVCHINYLGNAATFTERAHITLRCPMVEENADGNLLRFEVSDTGIGIKPEDQSRLFNAFEQADSSTTRKFGGSGLGLVIPQRVAQLMGGEVGVASEFGVGSTFWLTVPLGRGQTTGGGMASGPGESSDA